MTAAARETPRGTLRGTSRETSALVADLRAAGLAEVDGSTRRRAEYATDASNYRVLPAVVAFPRHADEVLAALEVARRTGTPLTVRGAGTSIAGNSIGPGIVLDTSRHLHRVLEVDPQARTARVEPGTVMATLQLAAGAARPAVRPRPVDVDPRHPRRDDRQQRLRPARGGLRQDRPERALARLGRRRRDVAGPPGRATRPSRRCPGWPTSSAPSWPCCAPSSAGSAARSRATRSSTCCRRTAPTSRAPSSAPRAPAVSCSRPSSTSCRCRPPRPWWCSATPTCPPRPTPSPRCSPTARSRSRGWTRGWSSSSGGTGVRRTSRSSRREAAG